MTTTRPFVAETVWVPERLVRCWIEEWTTPEERVAGDPAALQALAWARWKHARIEWQVAHRLLGDPLPDCVPRWRRPPPDTPPLGRAQRPADVRTASLGTSQPEGMFEPVAPSRRESRQGTEGQPARHGLTTSREAHGDQQRSSGIFPRARTA